mgnify:CR=1 FL=1
MNTRPTVSGDPSLNRYFQEIKDIPRLTREDEIDLARRIRKGDAEARDRLINANLRLVVKIARKYQNCGLPLEDLVSEGNVGLTTAAERFDPSFGLSLIHISEPTRPTT